MMKNTIKLLAVMANIYLLELIFQAILPDRGAIMLADGGLGVFAILSMIAGASRSGSGPTTVTRDAGAEYESALRTQLKYADQVLAADQYYTPQYTDLSLSNMERTLFGTKGQASGGAVPLEELWRRCRESGV